MRVLVTGSRGTVGRALAERLGSSGHTVVGWNRAEVPIDRYDAMDRFVGAVAPDALVNLAIASQPTGRPGEGWLVNHEWPSELAWICRQRAIRFVHASTVMVFAAARSGPFAIDAVPDAPDGYGCEKRLAEARVRYQNPAATIVRLGWQIGTAPGSNNMIDHFDRMHRERGVVTASPHFFPACSFLPDTAAAIERALAAPPDLYQLDGNERWSLHAIAVALATIHGWRVEPGEEPRRDERMIDPRLGVASLATRLPLA
jgi:dTDP-4-dehydrorhamnose reductase